MKKNVMLISILVMLGFACQNETSLIVQGLQIYEAQKPQTFNSDILLSPDLDAKQFGEITKESIGNQQVVTEALISLAYHAAMKLCGQE